MRWPTPTCAICKKPVTLKASHSTWYEDAKPLTAHFSCRYR